MARYTKHARQKMADRGITEDEVEQVLANPEITYPSEDRPDCDISVRTIGAKRIKVVAPTADPNLVITAADQLQED